MKETNIETQAQGTVDRIMSNSYNQTNDKKNDGLKIVLSGKLTYIINGPS